MESWEVSARRRFMMDLLNSWPVADAAVLCLQEAAANSVLQRQLARSGINGDGIDSRAVWLG